MSKNKITFINKTGSNISKVSVVSHSTNRKLSCGFIPKDQYCSYSFGQELKNNNKIGISWQYKNKQYQQSTYIDVIEKKHYPLTLSVEIFKEGKVIVKGLKHTLD